MELSFSNYLDRNCHFGQIIWWLIIRRTRRWQATRRVYTINDGKDIYLLFKDVKSIFDPKNVFNKGKIVDAPPMDQSLRYQTESKVNEVATTYNFSDHGGFCAWQKSVVVQEIAEKQLSAAVLCAPVIWRQDMKKIPHVHGQIS